MMTLEQAKQILDTVLGAPFVRMAREDHRLAAEAVELLYSTAADKKETEQEPTDE